MKLLKENKQALHFIGVFIAVYVLLNSAYGLFVNHYAPTSDPFTQWIARQVVWCLGFFDPSIAQYRSDVAEYIAIANDQQNLIYVYEGCNGLNVVIVYISFLLAFRGPVRLFVWFVIAGIPVIHLLNLARIGLLYGVALHFPDQLYFFHKYLFTGFIYVFVFAIWFLWVRMVSRKQDGQA